jgi:succinyl-diaminopimelate desuccinylase
MTVDFNFRFSTEIDADTIKQMVEDALDQHDMEYKIDWHLSGEPFLTDAGVLTTAVSDSIEEISGIKPELSTGGGTSDGRFISPAGADVVELGPVNASIHKVNEYVNLEDVSKLTRIYERIVERLLG